MGPAVVCAINDLTNRVFEQIETTTPIGVDKRVNYLHFLLRGSALNKYKTVLVECKELVKGIDGYQWTLGAMKDVTMEQF